MGSFGNYAEDAILDHLVGKTSFTMPTCYLALSTADPLDDASGLTEPVGGSYARKQTAGGDWNAASGGAIDNANDLSFVTATGDWGTISHLALMDAATLGNMLAHGALTASKDVDNGDTAKFSAGEINITLD
jgi:hypothetical protein